MKILKNELITQKYTYIEHEEDYKYNAPHHFIVKSVKDGEPLSIVNFQEGAIKECGVNGVANEDLIAMVIKRLESFQESPYACEENAIAITKLKECLISLRNRTNKRVQNGTEGTSKI